jgi:hypothetical protein
LELESEWKHKKPDELCTPLLILSTSYSHVFLQTIPIRRLCRFPLVAALGLAGFAQSHDSQLPWLIKYAGKLERSEQARVESLTFSFYESEQSPEAIYRENHTISVAPNGEYMVLLGGSGERDAFVEALHSARAKWIGVRPQNGGVEKRAVFVAVPYALAASDANTLKGHAASEFVRTSELQEHVLAALEKTGPRETSAAYAYRPGDEFRFLTHIPRAHLFPGTDACAKINAAIRSTDPIRGGAVDATGLIGIQPCAFDMFAEIGARGGEIWFSQVNFHVTAEQNWPSNWRLRGMPGTQLRGTWFTWKGVPGKSIFRLMSVRWTLMDGFNLDCTNTPITTGLSLLTNYSSQHTRFENFSIHNCPVAVQWGDNGPGSALNQADRVEFRHFEISAPVIQTTAKGFVINSSNSGQTSVIEDGQIVNVNVGIDIPHLESGIFTVKRVQCNIKGNNAAFIRMAEVYDIHIEKTQCENNGLVGDRPSHILVNGSNNLSATITLMGNTINFPIRINSARSIVSIGNNGLASGYAFHPLTVVTSIGDRMGGSYGDLNWISPTTDLTNAEVVRVNGAVTVTLLPVPILNLSRKFSYTVVTTTKPHYMQVGQPFSISGSNIASFNVRGVVCSNPPICPAPTPTSFAFEDFGPDETASGGSVQPEHGLVPGALVSLSGMGSPGLNAAQVSTQITNAQAFTYQSAGADLTTTGGTAQVNPTVVEPERDRPVVERANINFTLNGGEQRQITALWPIPFRDASYTVSCDVVSPKADKIRLDLSAVSPKQVEGALTNLEASTIATGTLHCMGVETTDLRR